MICSLQVIPICYFILVYISLVNESVYSFTFKNEKTPITFPKDKINEFEFMLMGLIRTFKDIDSVLGEENDFT